MVDFAAPRWFRSPHLQTLGAAAPLYAPPREGVPESTRLRIPLSSDHHLHAHAWWSPGEGPRMAVLVVHGIGGSSASPYVVRAAVALRRAGFHVVRLDLRGAGGSLPDVPSLYHAGLSSDVGVAVDTVAGQPRVDGVAVLGFSGGGSLGLKLAGERGGGERGHLRGVVAVSAPLDYTAVAPWMDSVRRLPYRFHVLRGLSKGARDFARLHPERAHYRPADVRRLSSFRHYDGTIIAPMHGFPDVDTYYASASAGPWLARVAVPTLLIHADDDPMVPGFTVRPWLTMASSAVRSAISAHGGHLGWVSGIDESAWITNWATERALTFLRELGRGARVGRADAA